METPEVSDAGDVAYVVVYDLNALGWRYAIHYQPFGATTPTLVSHTSQTTFPNNLPDKNSSRPRVAPNGAFVLFDTQAGNMLVTDAMR
jgi:hypothetical protein